MKIKYFIILLFVILVSLPILAEPGDQPKAVIIIASSMFQDQEYDTVKTVL